MRGLAGLAVALGLVACNTTVTPQDEVHEVASTFCQCFEPANSTCVPQIEAVLGTMVSADCADCVFANEQTCANMIQQCEPLCIRNALPGGQ